MHCFYYESELKGKKDFLKFEQKKQIFFFAFFPIWGDFFWWARVLNFLSILSFQPNTIPNHFLSYFLLDYFRSFPKLPKPNISLKLALVPYNIFDLIGHYIPNP